MRVNRPSMADSYTILKFAAQYITTHPRIWSETSDVFLELHSEEVKVDLLFRETRPMGKTIKGGMRRNARVRRVQELSADVTAAEEKRDMVLADLARLTQKMAKNLMSLEFDEDTYGAIEDLESSNLFRLFSKLCAFHNVLSGNTDKTTVLMQNATGKIRKIFWMMFVEHIRIENRLLDAKILDYVLPMYHRNFPMPLSDPNERWYDSENIQSKWLIYTIHNGGDIEEQRAMIAQLLDKISDPETQRSFMTSVSESIEDF